MKKTLWRSILTVTLILVILFTPIPSGAYKDGGTREYRALTYKLVDWNRVAGNEVYDAVKLYWFPNNFQSIDRLWAEEEQTMTHKFVATVLEVGDGYALVQPVEGEEELLSSDKFSISTAELGDFGAQPGSEVEITYVGIIMESYPAQIHATRWAPATDLRHRPYDGQFLNKDTAQKQGDDFFGRDLIITHIYADCFFAQQVIPMPDEIKLNGTLSDDWCVGDQVYCTYENTYYDSNTNRIEADLVDVTVSDFVPDPNAAYKPVIYLYPETKTEVSVQLLLDGKLTCTYPAYNGGWNVTAAPDGTLTDAAGQTYSYLYWEGETAARWDMTEGFCVKGEDTATFLEDALERLGLTRREANEFIVYWLPLMEQNPYNLISFQTDVYTNAPQLQIDPAPDTLIRVFMAWQASEYYVNLPIQTLTTPVRAGFTVVEWGGTEVK